MTRSIPVRASRGWPSGGTISHCLLCKDLIVCLLISLPFSLKVFEKCLKWRPTSSQVLIGSLIILKKKNVSQRHSSAEVHLALTLTCAYNTWCCQHSLSIPDSYILNKTYCHLDYVFYQYKSILATRPSVLGQDTEPQMAPDGRASALRGSSLPSVCECVCVCASGWMSGTNFVKGFG